MDRSPILIDKTKDDVTVLDRVTDRIFLTNRDSFIIDINNDRK